MLFGDCISSLSLILLYFCARELFLAFMSILLVAFVLLLFLSLCSFLFVKLILIITLMFIVLLLNHVICEIHSDAHLHHLTQCLLILFAPPL